MRNKFILVLIMFLSNIIIQAQKTCDFTRVQQQMEQKNPESKQAREKAEAWLLSLDKQEYFRKSGIISKNGKYAGTVYEIPIVVHVIESTDASNAGLSLTDAQIQTWIDNANKMYATTYGNGYYAEGSGVDGGTVIPIKLVLAKRAPNCTSTTGIIRYNGSALFGSDYDDFGVTDTPSEFYGISMSQVKSKIPHWPENSYFNIYIPVGLNEDKSDSGTMGWCTSPTSSDYNYESFMKVSTITSSGDSTLAHEFGHGMGLDHPFGNANSDGGECPPNTGVCTVDDDKVCDTAPTQSLFNTNPTPANSVINPCTGVNYEGVQYNIMNYTLETKKFTPGQRDRALALFIQYRKSLTQSLVAINLTVNSGGGTPKAASCIPQTVTKIGSYNAGPTRVQLGSIDNSSSGNSVSADPTYYKDYSAQNCISPVVYTNISKETPSTITVTFVGNSQTVKAWIDYNNDGAFDSSELIANSITNISATTPFSATFTPPANAVTNTPLRMRVRADKGDFSFCDDLYYGQIEDYTVTIISDASLSTNDVIDNDKLKVVYISSENKLRIMSEKNEKVGEYQIYDLGGKLIQSGKSNNLEIQLNKYLPIGTYLLNLKNSKKKSYKFIKY